MTRTALATRQLLLGQSVGAVRLVGRYVVWRRSEDEYAIWPGRNVYSAAPSECRYSLSEAVETLTREELGTMNTYTVIAIRADAKVKDGVRGATIVHAVDGVTPTLATRQARREMTTRYPNNPGNPDDFAIIAVFEGCLANLYEPSLDSEAYERSVNVEED